MAFEPTHGFRDALSSLLPGDKVRVVGAVNDGLLKLEKLRIEADKQVDLDVPLERLQRHDAARLLRVADVFRIALLRQRIRPRRIRPAAARPDSRSRRR